MGNHASTGSNASGFNSFKRKSSKNKPSLEQSQKQEEEEEDPSTPKDISKEQRKNRIMSTEMGKSPLKSYLKDKFINHKENESSLRPPPPPPLQPMAVSNSNVEKLAKFLILLTKGDSGMISSKELKTLVPGSPILGDYLSSYLSGANPSGMISETTFTTFADKVFALHTDKEQLGLYLKIFSGNNDMLERSSFLDFLICCYQLSLVGELNIPQSTMDMRNFNPFDGKEYFDSVVKSCYHIKDEMSLCFITNWILTNLPRCHHLLHKYILHQLTTGYSQLSSGNATINLSGSGITTVGNQEKAEQEEDENNKEQGRIQVEEIDPILLWLLKSSLPSKFLQVFTKKKTEGKLPPYVRVSSAQQLLLQLMQTQSKESWTLLYNSSNDGLSINRFQFHVFHYKGPTFMIIRCENGYTFGLANDQEWNESCHFWGGEESTLVLIQPEFRVVEKGTKLIYVNFSIRGYPFAIQAGKDPKNVSLDIKPDFSYASFKKIPCRIINFEVWGCAPKQTQTAQSEYKKWEAKQCENIRKVNINSAEWKDNPDKYLLELAGNYKSYNHQ